MEEESPKPNNLNRSLSRRNNSSIRIARQSRISQSKYFNEAVLVVEYEKIMEKIQTQSEKYRERIQQLQQLLEKFRYIKNNKTKLYYMKENIFLCLMKFLNKGGDQAQILNQYQQYMPEMIREAKGFEAKKGSIIMLIIMWAKCYYAIDKYQSALDLLQSATSLLQIFQFQQISNLLKISFLKAKIYQRQMRTTDYHNEIQSAYQIVKINNILSTLGLNIIQIYNNIRLYDDLKKNSKKSVHKSFIKQQKSHSIKARGSLQVASIQSRFQEVSQMNKSNQNFRNIKSNTCSMISSNKQKSKGSVIKKVSSKQGKFISPPDQFKICVHKAISTPKRSTLITESEINQQLLQLSQEKYDSLIENDCILKRPQYHKYPLCSKITIKYEEKPKVQIIQEQSKEIDKEEDVFEMMQLQSVINDGSRDKGSRRILKADADDSELNEDQSKEETPLDIIPLNFPIEYTKQQSSQSIDQLFKLQLDLQLSYWSPHQLIKIKKLIIFHSFERGLSLLVYNVNFPEIVVVKLEYDTNQIVTKQNLTEYFVQMLDLNISYLDDSSDQKIKEVLRILLMRYVSSKTKAPIGRVYKMQQKQILSSNKRKSEYKDRLRFARARKSIKFSRKIAQKPQFIKEHYLDICDIVDFQRKERKLFPKEVKQIRISFSKIIQQVVNAQKSTFDPLISSLSCTHQTILRQIRSGKYTIRSGQITAIPTLNDNLKFEPFRQTISKIFKQDQSYTNQFQLYQMMKFNLIMEESKNWIDEYFKQISISAFHTIQGIGVCKVELIVFLVKDIYEKDFMFLRVEIMPSYTKTKKIKFVITREDIKNYLGSDIALDITKDELFTILNDLKSKFLYIKDSLYYSLVLQSKQHYGYNKFALFQYQQVNNPKYFLTPRLKSVEIFTQKTIQIQLKNKRTYSVLTVEQLQGVDSLKVLIYIPSTNRRFEFSLPQRVLSQINNKSESDHQTNWNQILSVIRFESIDGGALIATLGSYSAIVTQSHFTCFGNLNKSIFHIGFKVFRKKQCRSINLLSQFENISISQLTEYEVYLQLNWLKKSKKLCYVFSIFDFIQLIMSLPKKVKVHKELECKYFNLADIGLMLSIGYGQIIASLIQIGEKQLQQLITNKKGKNHLQRIIQENLKKISKNYLSDIKRSLKSSLNSRKDRNLSDHLNIIHKGIFRFKDKSLIGIFNNRNEGKLTIKMYNEKKEIEQSEIKTQQLSIPFVGNYKQNVLDPCSNRILKMIKNRLLLAKGNRVKDRANQECKEFSKIIEI